MAVPGFLTAMMDAPAGEPAARPGSMAYSPMRQHPLSLESPLAEVLDWLRASRCDDPEVIEVFTRKGIDGAHFFSLSEHDLTQGLGLRFGPARKITRRRSYLPAYREYQNSLAARAASPPPQLDPAHSARFERYKRVSQVGPPPSPPSSDAMLAVDALLHLPGGISSPTAPVASSSSPVAAPDSTPTSPVSPTQDDQAADPAALNPVLGPSTSDSALEALMMMASSAPTASTANKTHTHTHTKHLAKSSSRKIKQVPSGAHDLISQALQASSEPSSSEVGSPTATAASSMTRRKKPRTKPTASSSGEQPAPSNSGNLPRSAHTLRRSTSSGTRTNKDRKLRTVEAPPTTPVLGVDLIARLTETISAAIQQLHGCLSQLLPLLMTKTPLTAAQSQEIRDFSQQLTAYQTLLHRGVRGPDTKSLLPQETGIVLQGGADVPVLDALQATSAISKMAITVNRIIPVLSRLKTDLANQHLQSTPESLTNFEQQLRLISQRNALPDPPPEFTISLPISEHVIDLKASQSGGSKAAPADILSSSNSVDAPIQQSRSVGADLSGPTKYASASDLFSSTPEKKPSSSSSRTLHEGQRTSSKKRLARHRSSTVSQTPSAEEEGASLMKGVTDIFRRPTSLAIPRRGTIKPSTSDAHMAIPHTPRLNLPVELILCTQQAFFCLSLTEQFWKCPRRITLSTQNFTISEPQGSAVPTTVSLSAIHGLSLTEIHDDGKISNYVPDARFPLTAIEIKAGPHSTILVFKEARAAFSFALQLDGCTTIHVDHFLLEAEKRKFLMLFFKDPFCEGGALTLCSPNTSNQSLPPSAAEPEDDDSSTSSSSSSEEKTGPVGTQQTTTWVYKPSGVLLSLSGPLEGMEYFWDGIRLIRSGPGRKDHPGDLEWNSVIGVFLPRCHKTGSLDRSKALPFLYNSSDHSFLSFAPDAATSSIPPATDPNALEGAQPPPAGCWRLQDNIFAQANLPDHQWSVKGAVPPPVMLAVAIIHYLSQKNLALIAHGPAPLTPPQEPPPPAREAPAPAPNHAD